MTANLRSLRINTMIVMGLLLMQYALGMYANLFVTFPEPDKPGQVDHGQMWGFAWSQPVLAAHITIAFILLGTAIWLYIRVLRAKERRLLLPSGLGLAAICAAWLSGATFVPYQIDLYSYSMSLFFLLALLSYGWGLMATREAPER